MQLRPLLHVLVAAAVNHLTLMLNGWKWSCRKCESNVGCARHFRWRSRQIKAISLTLFHCYSVLLMQFESFNWQITKESTGFHLAMTLLIVLLLIQLQGLLKAKKNNDMAWHEMTLCSEHNQREKNESRACGCRWCCLFCA